MISTKNFWIGFAVGCLAVALLSFGLVLWLVSASEGITGPALAACSDSLKQSAARIADLQRPIVLFEDKAPAELPAYDFHGLIQIRPGAAFASADVRPRWIVQPGQIPADTWRAPSSGYGLWDVQARTITGPFKVQ